jgi:hypothetical protein
LIQQRAPSLSIFFLSSTPFPMGPVLVSPIPVPFFAGSADRVAAFFNKL